MPDTIAEFYIAPCHKTEGDNVERCAASAAEFWSLYWRDHAGLSQCVGDFSTREDAKRIGETLARASDVALREWSEQGESGILPTPNLRYAHAETALCVMEDFLDSLRKVRAPSQGIGELASEHDKAVSVWRENSGIYALRQFAIGIAPNLHAAWEAMGGAGELLQTFDWEFVPRILRTLDINEDGLTVPDIAEMVAEGRKLESELEARASAPSA